MARKSSLRISLVLLGAAAIAGCGEDDQRRDIYKSREDCLADWANRPEDCAPATQPRHAASHYWYGPVYPYRSWSSSGSDWTSNARSTRAVGTTSHSGIARGGFGASGRSSSG
jgi:uncharacterized protein YgiB involved in biofilm formation